MGIFHSTYFAFGLHVPENKFISDSLNDEIEYLDWIINGDPVLTASGVGHMTAGAYDQDMLFLVVVPDGQGCEVPLGSFIFREPTWTLDMTNGAVLLNKLILAAGYPYLGSAGWLVVPDAS